jgi:hypothetical protein
MIKCPLTGSTNTKIIYKQKSVPLIQNKVYSSKEQAKNAPCIDVILAQSLDNGFVFNADFTESIINYDTQYQNEQSNSVYFRKHLNQVIEIMESNQTLNGKVVEIGCGKAFFMNMLLERGVDVTGFDPAYEGESSKIIKDFFSEKYFDMGAEFIILRHTLEHISKPFHFIKTIAASNNYRGKIYIEVPTFEWIMKYSAIEDIFYEHCNYFTLDTLQMFFRKSVGGHFFNGQYIYVIADLSDINDEIPKRSTLPVTVKFDNRFKKISDIIDNSDSVAIWGAGAKGSTFLNLMDKEGVRIKCVVDINPKKQHHYIGGTGHYIIEPEELKGNGIMSVILMNINYIEEVKFYTEPLNINLITL